MFVSGRNEIRNDLFVHSIEIVERFVVMIERRSPGHMPRWMPESADETVFDFLDERQSSCSDEVWSGRAKSNNIDAWQVPIVHWSIMPDHDGVTSLLGDNSNPVIESPSAKWLPCSVDMVLIRINDATTVGEKEHARGRHDRYRASS